MIRHKTYAQVAFYRLGKLHLGISIFKHIHICMQQLIKKEAMNLEETRSGVQDYL